MRLIDADKLMEYVKGRKTRNYPKGELEWTIKQMPTIEAVPAVHGEWIAQDESRTKFMCSVCSGKNYGGHEKYCPGCGSKMDGVV